MLVFITHVGFGVFDLDNDDLPPRYGNTYVLLREVQVCYECKNKFIMLYKPQNCKEHEGEEGFFKREEEPLKKEPVGFKPEFYKMEDFVRSRGRFGAKKQSFYTFCLKD